MHASCLKKISVSSIGLDMFRQRLVVCVVYTELDIGGRIILKLILDTMGWYGLN
jgi:hypothetical protein